MKRKREDDKTSRKKSKKTSLQDSFDEFLSHIESTSSKKVSGEAHSVMDLFSSFVDGYGYQYVEIAEEEKERVLENFLTIISVRELNSSHFSEFMYWYLIKKCFASKTTRQESSRVMKKYVKFLIDEEYCSKKKGTKLRKLVAKAGKDLLRAYDLDRNIKSFIGTKYDGYVVEKYYWGIKEVRNDSIIFGVGSESDRVVLFPGHILRDARVGDSCCIGFEKCKNQGSEGSNNVYQVVNMVNVYPARE